MKYLRDLLEGIRLFCGITLGTRFDFERSGNYPDFKQTELITQELVDKLQLEDLHAKIDDRNIEEETRMEPQLP